MQALSIEEIRSATLQMMDHIHHICIENDIQYFLHYGTLIGAIRHNGFIPWDDDFDIAMKRKDYEKFCKVVEREHHPHYKLCNRANTENYYYGIARYADTRFKYESDLKLKQADIGIFIDIYPLDNFGNTPEEAKSIKAKIAPYNTKYSIYVNGKSLQGPIRTLLRFPIHCYYKVKYGKNFNSKIDNLIYKKICSLTNDSDSQMGVIVWDASCWPFKKTMLEETILHDFEGHQYLIPAEYDAILTMIYGDYMKPPSVENQKPTHYYKIYKK